LLPSNLVSNFHTIPCITDVKIDAFTLCSGIPYGMQYGLVNACIYSGNNASTLYKYSEYKMAEILKFFSVKCVPKRIVISQF